MWWLILLVVVSTFFIIYDAQNHKMGKIGSKTPAPYRYGIGCLILWIFFAPFYVIRRNTWINRAKKSPYLDRYSSGEKTGFIIALLIVLGLTYFQYQQGYVPKCNSESVLNVLGKIYNENEIKDLKFSDAGEYKYDASSEIRFCRASMHYNSTERIVSYKVTWLNNDQDKFMVEIQ